MKYGLKDETLDQITAVLSKYQEIEKAILYGSRAKGNFHNASDIDLALQGNLLNIQVLNKISWSLDDLLLPYKFDLAIYNHIKNKELLAHIERIGLIIYERKAK